MSETPGEYNLNTRVSAIPWNTFIKRGCLNAYSSGKYINATSRDVYTLVKKMQWSDREVADIVGAQFDETKGRGSTTVKGWMRPESSSAHRKISYAAWRLMLINAGLAKS